MFSLSREGPTRLVDQPRPLEVQIKDVQQVCKELEVQLLGGFLMVL